LNGKWDGLNGIRTDKTNEKGVKSKAPTSRIWATRQFDDTSGIKGVVYRRYIGE
jgi:hypothetical protein